MMEKRKEHHLLGQGIKGYCTFILYMNIIELLKLSHSFG